MELTVEGIHPAVILCVRLPCLLRLGLVETGGVLQIEVLHIGHLCEAFVIQVHSVIPNTGAALLYGSGNGVDVDDLIADVPHNMSEDYLVHTGEAFRFQQIGNRQLPEALIELKLLLHLPGNFVQRLPVV